MFNAILTMLAIGAAMGLILAIAENLFHIEIDPRIAEVKNLLPGLNCGGCGHPGCAGMAEALVKGQTTTINCRPCPKEQAEKIVAYLANTPDKDGKTVNVKTL